MRRLMTCLMLLTASILLAAQASAFELLMFRRAGCPWCAAWDREVGPIYPKTEVGQRIAIRFIDLDVPGGPRIKLVSPVHFTPTFVLVEEDREVGRIEGYPGEDFFWSRLEALVPDEPERLSTKTAEPAAGTPR
jgi:thioredoxin-related protein